MAGHASVALHMAHAQVRLVGAFQLLLLDLGSVTFIGTHYSRHIHWFQLVLIVILGTYNDT